MKHAILTSIVFALFASVSLAIQPAELVDAELQRHAVKFVTLGGGELSYFDDQRRLQRVDAADFVSLQFPDRKPSAEPKRASQMLILRDGTMLRGSFGGAADGKLIWVSRALGPVRVELDRITRVTVMNDAPPLPADVEQDVSDKVILANGDHLAGFIESIDAAGLSLAMDGQQLNLAWDRVATIILPNPVVRGTGVWVGTVDGSRFVATEPSFDGETLTGTAMGKDLELAGDQVKAIDFAVKHQLVRISEMETELISGGEVFGVLMGPEFDGDTARLHAPLTMELNLPAGAHRFAATARLDEADLAWADLVLTVADGKGELLTQRLNADQPSVTINVAPRTGSLTFRLDAGVNGPIRDRLQLTNAVVLTDTE